MTSSLHTSTAPRTDTGLFVRQLRQLVDLTQAQFAEKLGVSIPTVARWENNRSQPSPLALMQLKAMVCKLKVRRISFRKTALKPCWLDILMKMVSTCSTHA